MIQVDGLSLAFSGDPVLEDVSFTIGDGERCGLVGRNGSGKTTLLKLLIGQEKPDQGTIAVSKGYRLGYLDQHIRFSKDTVLEEAALGLQEPSELYKAEKILFGLGFKEEEMERSPKELSGGYALRVHLAKALLAEPDCLLLDEPTNYLDILSIRFLAGFLKGWKRELILISHDREFMDAVTTHTMGVHRKKVRKVKGGTTDFYELILQQEMLHERTRANLEKKRAHMQSFIDRFGAKASKAKQAQARQKLIERIPVLEELKALYGLDFHFLERPFPGRKMTEAKDVDFSYTDQPLVRGFSLEIEKGERVAVIGKNGYGKSTLLKLIAGELEPKEGSVGWAEQTAIGYFGQTHIQRLKDTATIEEEIESANPALNLTQAKAICGLMMFPGDASKKKISVLSGGERSRVLLGKILAKPCNLLLLDEPTHHLDMESIEALIDALEEFDGSVVIVTHSELILKRLALDKIVVCHKERQELFLGGYEEFLEKEGWEEEKPIATEKPRDERKKQHEERMAARARVKPLEIELSRIEAKIGELEKKQNEDNLELIAASGSGDAARIQGLSKSISVREKELETLYEQFLEVGETLQALKGKG